MATLQDELLRLQNRGDTVLASTLEALLSAEKSTQPAAPPFSRRLLAQAAQEIKKGKLGNGHHYIGAAIEAYRAEAAGRTVELPSQVVATLDGLGDVPPGTEAFLTPLPELPVEAPAFDKAPEAMISGFANLLLAANYLDEARDYLSGYNKLNKGEPMKSDKQVLTALRDKFRKTGNLAMARTVDEVLAEMPEKGNRSDEMADEAQACGNGDMSKAAGQMKAAEDLLKGGDHDEAASMMKAAEDMYSASKKGGDAMGTETLPQAGEKPALEVETPSHDEVQAREMATASALKGNVTAAKQHLAKASKLERMRLVAALIKAGDMDLAMEGLAEDEPAHDEPAHDEPAHEDDPAPVAEDQPADPAPVAEDQPADPVAQPDKTETDTAKEMAANVTASLARGNIRTAKAQVAKIRSLETTIVAAVKKCRDQLKDLPLAKEGYVELRGVRKTRLLAQLALADAMGDDDSQKEALDSYSKMAEGHDDDDWDLDDTLSSDPEESEATEVTPAPVLPEGGKSEEAPVTQLGAPVDPAGEPEGHEDQAMHYEVLQSVAALKGMKVDRTALAFTFWDHAENPYWVIQASGHPVATVHLADQDNAQDIRAFFCAENDWPTAVATTTEKVGLYDTLRGVNARFYANQVEKSQLAAQLRTEAVASLSSDRVERLTNLRREFTDAVVVASQALNKGLIASKPNALKASFHKVLASLGIQNPSLIVEACFADGFQPFMEQVMADANEFLEMPKEAFAHTRRMIESATNVAQVTAAQYEGTLAQRLAANSLPVAPDSSEVAASVYQGSDRDRRTQQRDRLGLSRKY